jgi:hypothetical protein
VPFKVRLDALVRRQIAGWHLPESLLIDVHLRSDDLPRAPAELLRRDPDWFSGEGMVHGFDLIDPVNRMLVHAFRFQVFYLPDEETLLVARGAHVTGEGL